MDDFCLVVCGEWRCSQQFTWDFEVDQVRLSRMVRINSEISLKEMEKVVKLEFGVDGLTTVSVVLSYMPQSGPEKLCGVCTPPVNVGSDVGLRFFLAKVRTSADVGLFVKINVLAPNTQGGESSRKEEGCSYLTPLNAVKRTPLVRSNTGSSRFSGKSHSEIGPMPSFNLIDSEDYETHVRRHKRKEVICEDPNDVQVCSQWLPEKVAKTDPANILIDDDDLLDHVQRTEEKMPDDGFGDVLSTTDSEPDELVTPRNYDREFWPNFIDDVYGGSNAADIMSGSDAMDRKGKKVDTGKVFGGLEPEPSKYGINCSVEHRTLGEIDDEEFDIPPLYDDSKYVRDGVLDLDCDPDDEVLYKGKVYSSKEDCQISLAIFAIKEQFYFKQTRTDRRYFVLSCADNRCDWRVLAHECNTSPQYKIRKAFLEHSCDLDTRRNYKKLATTKVLARMYRNKYSVPVDGPLPVDMQQLVLEDLKISSSYMKCWRLRDKAVEGVRGTDDESYQKLAEYLYAIKLTNPGTVTAIETEKDDEGNERFLYAFLSFGASIRGFKYLRRVLVFDGTHLGGKYKGVLLTASGQDANFQVLPLVYAVVNAEDNDSWTWFFQMVEHIVADSNTLTIISDRCQSIYNAKARIYPQVHHAACLVHLQRNVVAKFKNQGIAKLVSEAARAYKIGRFRHLFSEIKNRNNTCANFLEKIGMQHWTRCYFQGNRYNIMTSNTAEQLNKALLRGRSSPIVELFMFIHAMMTRWFNARRKKSLRHRGSITPEVDKVMAENKANCKAKKINSIDDWCAEVVGLLGEKNTVLLKDRKCTCKLYDKELIPWGHAIMYANIINLGYGTLVGDCYRTHTWVATYDSAVYPHADLEEIDVPEAEVMRHLMPPKTRRPSGRPKESRILSTGEIPKGSSQVGLNRCG